MARTAILRADAGQVPLPDHSVDLIMTSPPYWQKRTYTDGGEAYVGQLGQEPSWQEYLDTLIGMTREWCRVLKPTGSLFVNIGDKYGRGTRTTIHGGNSKTAYADGGQAGTCVPTGYEKSLIGLPWRYALRCVDQLGLVLRAEIIWHKPNALPESAGDRVSSKHEQLFHFTRNEQYYSDGDAVREPQESLGQKHNGKGGYAGAPKGIARGFQKRALNPDGKMPGSVWHIDTEPLRLQDFLSLITGKHYASFPTALVRPAVLGWSPPGGVVLDPMGGTGTVALVSSVLGRTGLTMDLSEDYLRIATWRVGDGSERSLARGEGRIPKAKRVNEYLYSELFNELDAMTEADGG